MITNKKKLIALLFFISFIFLCIIFSMYYQSHRSKTYNLKKDFGAKGDGIHDDTAIFQYAINKVPKGSIIIVPKGKYKIKGISKFKVKTKYGDSYSAIKIDKPIKIIFKNSALLTNTKKKYGLFWIYKTSKVTINGAVLIGDRLPTEGLYTSRVGILLQNSKKCVIKNVILKNFTQGINLYFSKENKIENVVTENNMASGIISFHSNNNIISKSVVRNSSDGDLSLYGGGKDNWVKNCIVIEDRKNRLNEQGITVESEMNSKIENNKVTGFYYGIDIKNGSKNILVSRNHVFNNQYNISIRSGDSGNTQATSSHITLIKNIVLDVRDSEPNGGISIGVGFNHIVKENLINRDKLIVKSKIVNLNNIDILGVKSRNNLFVK